MSRKIIHIDMDCFYAAVEQRDNPSLKNLPVAVGGRPERRGVIATCNYIARDFGVHSALSSVIAKRRCPDLIIIPPNLNKYRDVSKVIGSIFLNYTEVIEPLSLDEAYLDVTDSPHFSGSATLIAQQIKKEIKDAVNLTASAGVAPNKYLAKIASDWHKPNGLKVITPEQVSDFVFNLPVSTIHGVGKVTANKLKNMNIRTCGELQALKMSLLNDKFGRFGKRLYQYARGIDEREVITQSRRKSVSVERTFNTDYDSVEQLYERLPDLIEALQARIGRHKKSHFKSVFVKIKFNDFTTTTVERRAEIIFLDVYQQLVREAYERQSKPVRLLGVGVRLTETEHDAVSQLELPFY